MAGLVSRRGLLSIALAGSSAVALGLLDARRALGQASGAGSGQAGASNGASGTTPGPVDEKDSLAVALGYVADAKRVDPKSNPTYQAGATCAGCSWYQGKAGDAGGPCTFFPGKQVNANGWCRMWAKKK